MSHKAKSNTPKTRRSVPMLRRQPLGPKIARNLINSCAKDYSKKKRREMVRAEKAEIALKDAQDQAERDFPIWSGKNRIRALICIH